MSTWGLLTMLQSAKIDILMGRKGFDLMFTKLIQQSIACVTPRPPLP